jgi:hypothetical protein
VAAVDGQPLAGEDLQRLIELVAAGGWRPLAVGLRRTQVANARTAYVTTADAGHLRDLARALRSLGVDLWEVGEYRDALTTTR